MLYANTDDGSSALWVCDGSGVVVDNISIYGAERAPILTQINEHYGTSFTGWSDNEIGLRIGDTVPNWDAYEKIGITPVETQFKFEFFGSYNFGDYINKKVRIGGPDETHFFNTTSEGEIESIGEFDENAKYNAKEFLVQYLGEIQNIEIKILTGLNVGDDIPNWEDYELLTT